MTERKRFPADPPELEKAFDLIRQVYWDEHERGFKDCVTKAMAAVSAECQQSDLIEELKS